MIDEIKKAPAEATADVTENKSNKFTKDNYITLDELCDRRRFYREQLDKEPCFSKAYRELYNKFETFNLLVAWKIWGGAEL